MTGNDNSSLLHTKIPERLAEPSPFIQEDKVVIDTSHIKRDAIEKKHDFAYSIGHFSNDLCAAGWFFYFSYYLKFAVGMDGGQVGIVMLCGQIADGLTTPVVGLFSDRIKTRIGSRAPWYIVGTLIVLPCYFCIFLYPFETVKNNITTGQVVYYIVLASVFNIGWASVQIANMSVVNSITFSAQKRDKLVASRNTFTFIANIGVLLLSLLLFAVI